MNQEECLSAGINYNEGVARFVGNAGIYEKFLREFLSDTTFASLKAAMEAKDAKAAFQAGHTLKGLTGNLSLSSLYGKLVVFVDALRGEGNLPLAESLFPGVESEYKTAVDFIASHVG